MKCIQNLSCIIQVYLCITEHDVTFGVEEEITKRSLNLSVYLSF